MYSNHDVSFDEDLDLDRVLAGEFKILSPYSNNTISTNNNATAISNNKIYDDNDRKELITNVMGQFHNLMTDIKLAERANDNAKSPPLSPSSSSSISKRMVAPTLEDAGLGSTYIMESVDAMISSLLELKKGLTPMEADLIDAEIRALTLAQEAKKNGINNKKRLDDDNSIVADDSLTLSPLRLPVSGYDIESSAFNNKIKSPARIKVNNNDNIDDQEYQVSFADPSIEKLRILVDSFMTATQMETEKLAASISNNNKGSHTNNNTSNGPGIERLQSNVNSLMSSIRDERNQRSLLEKKLISTQEELLEMKIQHDVEKENFKLTLLRLKGQIRQLCSNSGLNELCNSFESEVERLAHDNESLRRKLLNFEEKDDLEYYDRNLLHVSNISNDVSVNSVKMQRQLTKIRRLGQEKEELKTAYEELKKKERLFHSSACIAHDASRRFQIASQENIRLKDELEKERSKRIQYEEDIKHLHLDLQDFQHSESRIRDEYNRKMQDITGLRSKIIQLEQENKNISKLNRFISKHSPDPEANNIMGKKLPLQGSYSSTINYKKGEDNDDQIPKRVIQGYLNQMDEKNIFNPNIDATLSILQDSIMCHSPILLPMLRKLSTEIHSERKNILIQREKLLLSVFKPGSLNNNNNMNKIKSSNEPTIIKGKNKTNNNMRNSC